MRWSLICGIIITLVAALLCLGIYFEISAYGNFCANQQAKYFSRDSWHYCLFLYGNEGTIKKFECINQECYFVKEEVKR